MTAMRIPGSRSLRTFVATVLAMGIAANAVAGPDSQAAPADAPALSAAEVSQKLEAYFFDAARSGNEATLKEFLAAHYGLDRRDAKGYTALTLAAYHGHEGAVRLLLRAGANPCLADNNGNTALLGAIFKAELTIARLLMNAGCDVNGRNAAGQTPAMYAALFGRVEILNALARKGADLEARDAAGNTVENLRRGDVIR